MMFLLFIFLIHCSSGELYNKTDNMTLLSHENIYSTILGTKNAWIIEFYNSWCGHCINFAPTWRLLAQDILDWKNTIKVAVIDCSVSENVAICREYEIMGYPTLKLFGSNLSKEDRGLKMTMRDSLDIPGIKRGIINFLADRQRVKNGSSTWVNLLEYKGQFSDIFKEAPLYTESAIAILVDNKSLIAEEVILDLGKYPMVYVRKKIVYDEFPDKPDTLPSIAYIEKSGNHRVVYGGATRQEITSQIIKELDLMKRLVVFSQNRGDKFDGEEIGAGDGPPNEDNKTLNLLTESKSPDTVYLVDIENALSYSLRQEVSLHKVISGEELDALKRYLEILIEYFPCRSKVCTFLRKFYQYVSSKGNLLKGEDLNAAIAKLSSVNDSKLPDQQAWVGCLGSKSHLRGYPCGLWTMFHALTVNAAIKEERNNDYNPKKVLQAIHGYVKYFFSCEECSNNFQSMYAEDDKVFTNVNDEVLWLWKGHNKVNKRLSGDLSEDPSHKKIQFPSWSNCPSCWKTTSQFNQLKVLKYLKKIYAKESLSLKGVQNEPLEEEPRLKDYERVILDDSYKTWRFSTFDINLCVMLYGISTLIIIGGYCMFMARRHFKRRSLANLYKV